jgi:formyl-CoA transferase
LSDSPTEVKRSPLLGEHTGDILRSILGLDDDEIEEARKDGAI